MQKRAIVTGCAGFIFSHTCRALLKAGHEVIGIDNLSCGFVQNMEDFFLDDKFKFIKKNVLDLTVEDIYSENIDLVFHGSARGELYF